MSVISDRLPQPGEVVRVRSRQFLVEDIVAPPAPGEQTLVRLSCLDDDAQGMPLEVLWEREVDAEIFGGSAWDKVKERGFDPPRLFSAYYHTLRWNCVTSTNPRLFQSPLRAGIQVHAYQLEPLRKALLLPRVNLFIADDVGLGKTIEAGLIVRELIMRQKVRKIVVACPPSVVQQWREELETRFGLTFAVFDREYVTARRRERGFSVNPWTTHSRFIISHALIRDETYAAPLRDWLGDFDPGALLILDEAHNAAPASGSRYAIDSNLTRVIRDLAARFEHRLFLSATPHNGHSNSFASLLEILDPQRFCRGVPVKSAKLLDAIMVRRLKADLREVSAGFPDRKVIQIDIRGLPEDAPELALSRLLATYRAAREARLKDATRTAQNAALLVVTSLQKRLLSSIEAFASTLRLHCRAVEKQAVAATAPTARTEPEPLTESLLFESPGNDDDRAELPEAEVQAEEEAAVEAATAASGGALGTERDLLAQMTKIAEVHRATPDPRVRRLVEWIGREMRPGGTWNDRRVLIFTEYADTKRYLEQQLRAAFANDAAADARIATFHGGMGEAAREEVKRAFNANPAKHALRILIATDAAREGVNLQNHCADLFHFDVPWNPSRMEQRNGRIDRKLQRAPEVRCHYFVFPQRAEDRVLEVLVKKTKTIQKELGSLSPVVERRLGSLFARGIAIDDADRLVRSIEGVEVAPGDRKLVEEELEAVRERQAKLTVQIDSLREILNESERWLGFDKTHFHDAVSASLSILGAEGLRAETPSDGTKRWVFPALDRRAGADPTWADTLDTLRVPRRADQKPWEWRRESPIRPVIFEDAGTLDADAVHLHLEHRVVQRLLGRFVSQGFVHDDLARACVAQGNDAIPRVIVIGRLSLYGPHAARLHDQIVAIAARWTEPTARREPLKPYGDQAEEKTLAMLEASLADPARHSIDDVARKKLTASAERDLAELLPLLRTRADGLAADATKKLGERGRREAREIGEIITKQRERIEATLSARKDDGQLRLDFPEEDERRQLEADRRHWHKRLGALDAELEREPERIRAGYVVKAHRVEPVGLVYLWPVSG